MRALCSVRGPLGGEARPLGAGARLLALRVPGQLQPLHFVVEAKSRVRDLKALASSHAQLQGMTDLEIFGLAIVQNGEYWFVDQDSKLSKYAPKSWRSSHTHGLDANGKPLLELHLVVQFHLESPLLLHDSIGRHLYFQQLHVNVRTRDTLPAEAVLLLSGLALQAQFGDAESFENNDYFDVANYAPLSLRGDWVTAAMRGCHREHRGLSKEDATIRFIREVCLLPDTINSHRYRMKQTKTESEPGTIWLLVTAKGIKVLPDHGQMSMFIWSSIGKLSFDRKKFEIRTEDGKITLYASSEEKCKYIFALCKVTHQFSMKITQKVAEILAQEEEERKCCYGYNKTINMNNSQNKNDQRISVISSTSSNTTSGIVSDRVQSEDELEIMIDTPPAPSTESLAFAHLLDRANSYLIKQNSNNRSALSKTSSLQLNKNKSKFKCSRTSKEESSARVDNSNETQSDFDPLEDSISLPDPTISDEIKDCSPSHKTKCNGSQCSSSCSTVVFSRSGIHGLSRVSNASSLEVGFAHTAQNSLLSDSSTIGLNTDYTQDTSSELYDGIGNATTIAASSETSGVYTMGSSEITSRSKMDAISEDSRTDYDDSQYEFKTNSETDLADFDSVSSILKSKSERSSPIKLRRKSQLETDCVDGRSLLLEQNENKETIFRDRTNSNMSESSFHGDGSDPTDIKHNILSASELSDLIVGRGVYPKRKSVSDTLDSVSDYVCLPLPFSGDSYLHGHEDTAPSDDNNPEGSFFDRPPTPPTRIDSRKTHNLSLPNILDLDDLECETLLPNKPPPPYEYNHQIFSSHENTSKIPDKEPPAYPGKNVSSVSNMMYMEKEEVAARLVTSKPMITILKAEAGEVGTSSERTFASPMVAEHRYQKFKKQTSSRKADRSKLAQGLNSSFLNEKNNSFDSHQRRVDSSVFVAMMKLPPPPPPRRTRLPPPPPISRLPPPPPPHNPLFYQQLYSDVDYVYYPMQDPAVSHQNYQEHKLTESRFGNMNKASLQYRSTPFLSTSFSASSVYGSIQNLSDSYIQLPGNRTSLYSLRSLNSSVSIHSAHVDRPSIPTRLPEVPQVVRARSDENLLENREPPPVKTRRMPPPPPPPYEHKKKLPTHLRDAVQSNHNSVEKSDLSAGVHRTKDANCDLDIRSLREKSKNLDLPLISALCNDKSLIKQTKAFGVQKQNKQNISDSVNEHKLSSKLPFETVDIKANQETILKQSTQPITKKITLRNPTDKLPALPVSEHTPRALSNTYVMHPSVIKSKRIQPSS